tara:strand:- start:128 stop:2146 length:2019 start_codon:yes stop_codon:yes gene_type:complete
MEQPIMSEVFDVELPNGETIYDIPVGTSKEVIQDKAIANGLATLEDFAPKPTPVEKEDSPWYQDAGNFLKGNMEIPMGLGGSIAGAAAGSPLGPVGMIAGGIIGGSVGSGAGSLTSDVLEGKELDFQSAVKESLISAGFDVATLGLGKVLKPAYLSAKAALGYTPQEVAQQIMKEGMETGSNESLKATQKILEEGGASLTRYQTGQASSLAVFAEKLGSAGLLSGREATGNAAKVNQAAQSALNDIANAVDLRTGASPAELGEAMFDIISAGRLALSDSYGEGLTSISSRIVNNTVNTGGIKKKLELFLKENTIKTSDVVAGKLVTKDEILLDPATTQFIKEQLSGTLEYGNMSAQALLQVDKMLSGQMRKFGTKGTANYNTVADRELAQLQGALKESFINTLKQADPKIATEYALLKNTYKEGLSGLLPVLNKNTVMRAEIGDYEALGKLLTKQTNSNKIQGFMSSLDEAYKQIGKREGLPSEIAYGTAKEAKQVIRQSFLRDLIPEASSPAFDVSDYRKLASQFSKPDADKRLKVIMGEDYGRVKQLFNLFSEASKKPEGNFGTLFLRGKEFSAIQGIPYAVGAGIGGAVGGTTGAMFGAGIAPTVILTVPIFLAKAASNPKAVNKLLAFEKMTFKSPEAMEKFAAFIVSDTIDALSDEEQAEIRNHFRQ